MAKKRVRQERPRRVIETLVKALRAANKAWNEDGGHPLTAEIESALHLGDEALGTVSGDPRHG